MPASIDIPQIAGFERPEASGARRSPSWFLEFVTRPFKDPDGRASWKQEQAERERRLALRAAAQR